MRHLLPRGQRFLHAPQTVCDVVLQSVVLTRVDPDHKSRIRLRDLHQFVQHRRNIPYIVELLADDIAPRHIGIRDDLPQRLQILPEIISRLHLILHDRQRNAPDRSQKPQKHARLLGNCRHDGVNLCQHRGGSLFFDQSRVRYLSVADALLRVTAGDPQELVLE